MQYAMSAETLRATIVDKQRPQCKGEPGDDAVANYLAAFHWQIFTDNLEEQHVIMKQLGYDNLEALRTDTNALKELLHVTMDHDNWLGYFHE